MREGLYWENLAIYGEEIVIWYVGSNMPCLCAISSQGIHSENINSEKYFRIWIFFAKGEKEIDFNFIRYTKHLGCDC